MRPSDYGPDALATELLSLVEADDRNRRKAAFDHADGIVGW